MPATIVQSNSGSFVGTSGSATLGAGTTTGNTLVVVVGAGPTSTIAVTGLTRDTAIPSGNALAGVFRKSAVGAETSWTVTAGVSGPVAWAAYELEGLDLAFPVDAKPTNLATYTSAATFDTFSGGTNPASTTYDGLVVAVHVAYIATTSPPTLSGHTQGLVEQHQVTSIAGAASITMSCSMLAAQSLLDPGPEPAVTRSDGAVGNGGATHVVYSVAGAKRAANVAVMAGFEWGTAAGLATGVSAAAPFDSLAGSPAIVTTTPRSGTYCLELSSSAAAESVTWDAAIGSLALTAPTVAVLVARVCVRFPSALPAGDVDLFAMGPGTNICVVRFRVASSQLGLQIGAGTEQLSATTVAPDTWYGIDVRHDPRANPQLADWQIDGVDQPQASLANAAQVPTFFRLGWTGATTATVRYDDVVVSKVAGHYPLGDFQVLPLKPDSAGTLTISGTAGNFQTFTGNGSTLTAWNAATALANIDDLPPTIGASADGLCQITLAASDYVNIPMETYQAAPVGAVRGVRLYFCGWAASTTAATIGFRDHDGVTEHTLFAVADPAFDADTANPAWVCRMAGWAPGSQAAPTWTQAKLDALAARVGFSGDATPDIGIHSVMAEVAVQPGGVVEAMGEAGGVHATRAVDPVTGGVLGVTVDTPADQGTTLNWTANAVDGSQVVAPSSTHTESFDAVDSSTVTSVEVVSDPEFPERE